MAIRGSVMAIDVGRERDRHFISVLGLGFPTIVADAANRARWLRGPPAFFVFLDLGYWIYYGSAEILAARRFTTYIGLWYPRLPSPTTKS